MKIWLIAIPLMIFAVACAPTDDLGSQEMRPPQEQPEQQTPPPEQGEPMPQGQEPVPEEEMPPGTY